MNDDGLQLISEEERQDRIDFYADHSIGWVARPRQGENGFLRRGKFKKASNMNFALMISCKVEEKLELIDRPSTWSQSDEAMAYAKALNEVLEEDGRAWADGNVRIGDYILISTQPPDKPLPRCQLTFLSRLRHSGAERLSLRRCL